MKKSCILLLALLCCAGLSAKELKVLMIGNSFSNSVKTYLPKVTASSGKHKIVLGGVSIGSCTLERHCDNFEKEQKDPNFKSYAFTVSGEKLTGRFSLTYALKYRKWDIVTIQQASAASYKKDKTLPYADKLIAYIRKLAPQAEIVVHQTWAWRADSSRYKSPKANLTQESMYKGIVENYSAVAQKHNLRIIPVGTAVQLYRQKLPVKPVAYTKAQLDALKKPAVLDLTGGDVVGWLRWIKQGKEQKEVLYSDTAHLNNRGSFMQACIWFMVLFDEPAGSVKLTINDKNMPLLLKCAEEAVKQYKK